MASIQTLAVAAQLKRLLYEHIRKLEDVTITRRFEENCGYRGKKLFVDFTTDAMIRIVMFWSFKAITSLRHVSETKHVSADGYLNLLKAAWLLQKIRSTPKIVPGFAEIKATKALVSTVHIPSRLPAHPNRK